MKKWVFISFICGLILFNGILSIQPTMNQTVTTNTIPANDQFNTTALPPIVSVFQGKSETLASQVVSRFVTKWGSYGTGNGQFNIPYGLAVNSTNFIYVADTINDRVQVFTKSGVFVTKWGSTGTGNGQFDEPRAIAVNSSNFVYVVDTDNARVQVFTKNGIYVTQWGSSGSGNGQFSNPSGIAINSSNFVYVTDMYNNRVQVFTKNGIYVTQWGSYGTGNGQFDSPSGIAINSTGYIYVSDIGNYRIQVFDKNGVFIKKWGSVGSGDGQLYFPFGLAINSTGYIFEADALNHRIQVFDKNGVYVTQWGSSGSGNGQFNSPYGVVVNSTGYIYVADSSNYRIQVFRPSLYYYIDSRNSLSFSCLELYFINATLNFQSNITKTTLSAYNYISDSWDLITYNMLLTNYDLSSNYYNGSLFQFWFRLNSSNSFKARITYNITLFYYNVTPPYFIHNQVTDVKPTIYPGPAITNLNISCLVYNLAQYLSLVRLQENLTGSITNHTMTNETLSKYFYYLNIGALTTGTLAYRFWANDTYNEINWTSWYYIRRDLQGPTVLSWSNPSAPDYTQTVHIYCNATDPNNVSKVMLTWSANNWVTNTTQLLVWLYQNTWRTATLNPIPAKPYWTGAIRTVVRWMIRANDTGGNVQYDYYSYTVQDVTPPNVVSITFPAVVQPFQSFLINVTMSEPADASGIDDTQALIAYGLESEGYAPHIVNLVQIVGNLWQGSISGQTVNETVRWFIFVVDKAGNNYTSSVSEYTVVQIVVLVNWSNFTFWVIILLGLLTLVVLLREKIPKRYYYLIGLALIIGITALFWLLLPWWQFQNLSFQQYMQLLGTTGQWWVILGITITLIGSVAVLWYFNPSKVERESIVIFS